MGFQSTVGAGREPEWSSACPESKEAGTKLLIVDDEPLVRVGLRTLIPWGEKGFRLIGEAAGVAQALDLARRDPPDLVLVDIVMPERDGFALIRELRALNGACKFIIVSCRSSIEYYKQAISLGVSEYVEKSTIEAEELARVVERVAAQIRREKLYDELLRAQRPAGEREAAAGSVIQAVLRGEPAGEGQIAGRLVEAGVSPPAGPYFLVLFDSHQVPDIDETGGVDSGAAVARLCQEILREAGSGFAFVGAGGRLGALYAPPGRLSGEPAAALQSAVDLCRRMQATIEQLFDTRASAGISSRRERLEELREAAEEAQAALEASFFGEAVEVFSGLPRPQAGLPEQAARLRERLLDARTLGDAEGLAAGLRQLTGELRRARSAPARAARELYTELLYHLLELLHRERIPLDGVWQEERTPAECLRVVPSILAAENLLVGLVERAGGYLRQREGDRHGHAVELIKKHVAENLERRLSLAEIAQRVALTPNYVSRLFRKRTGETLGAYAHRLKVEAAKELLFEGLRAWEVADRLGFSSESHFLRVFKAHTGLTTRDFLSGGRQQG